MKPIPTDKDDWEPRLVFLFSGHMIDAPGRAEPRFPPDKEPLAARAIAGQLDHLGAGPADLAICGGAAGGDLLFAEASLRRGLRLRVHIPFDVPRFLDASVRFADADWEQRFFEVTDTKRHAHTRLYVMTEEAGSGGEAADAFARTNLSMLEMALGWGAERVRFICLWNGREGDGPGGTKHMFDSVRERGGEVYHLDTTKLW